MSDLPDGGVTDDRDSLTSNLERAEAGVVASANFMPFVSELRAKLTMALLQPAAAALVRRAWRAVGYSNQSDEGGADHDAESRRAHASRLTREVVRAGEALLDCAAQVMGATLLTNDRRLLNLEGVTSRPLQLSS